MISKTCDNCDKPIEVEDDRAGQKVPCPSCGDINVMPQAASDRAVAAGFPPDSGPEVTVMRVRPAMFRARPFAGAGLVVLLIASFAGIIYFGLVQKQTVLFWLSVVVLLVDAGVLGFWKLTTLAASLEITNKRTIEKRGLFSKATSEVLHDNIRNLQITQSFKERVFGVGAIGISSSGQDGIEILLKDLRSPGELKRVIDLYRPL